MASRYRAPAVVEVEPEVEEKPKMRECVICKKAIPVKEHGRIKYCSEECRYEQQKRKQLAWYHKNKGKINQARKEKRDGKI